MVKIMCNATSKVFNQLITEVLVNFNHRMISLIYQLDKITKKISMVIYNYYFFFFVK